MTDLIVPVNGQLTVDSTLLDSVASYTCDSGYILVGDAMRTCTASGWSGGNPICGKVILRHSVYCYRQLTPTMHVPGNTTLCEIIMH